MIVSFCGHSKINFSIDETESLEKVLLEIVSKCNDCKFYLGWYGSFDELCLNILLKIKSRYNKISIVFITPYLRSTFNKLQYCKKYFDYSLYPPLENVPEKYAIIKRNEWMVDVCDVLITYVKLSFGGAFKTLNYAKRKKKKIINLAK